MLSRPTTGLRMRLQHFQDDGGDVVVRGRALGERQKMIEDEIHGFGGRFAAALRPHFVDPDGAEFDFLWIVRFVETIAGEQNAVAGGELDDVPVVGGAGEQSGGESAAAQPRSGLGGQQGQGHSGVGEDEFSRGGNEQSI